MKTYRNKFERLFFLNRWKQKKYSRNGSWTIIGISVHYASFDHYCYKLCFLGFDLHIWIEKIECRDFEGTNELNCSCCNGTGICEDIDGGKGSCLTCNGRGTI